MKIKFWQKCLIVAMTVAVLTATFVATAFAMPLDKLSREEYFLPYRIEFLDTDTIYQNVALSYSTTVSNTSIENTLDTGDIDLMVDRYRDSTTMIEDTIYPGFKTRSVKFYFNDYYRTGGSIFSDLIQIEVYDSNGDTDILPTITVSWNEQYYDSTNNYQLTIDSFSTEVDPEDAIIAIAPSQFVEHTNPIEQSTITDFTITFDVSEIGKIIMYSSPMSEDSVLYGVNIPPSVIPNVVNPNVIEWLTTSLNSFMNAEIFGNGITIGTVLGIAVATPLVIWFLKLLAGG